MIQMIMELDANVLLWIQDYVRSDAATPIFTFITKLGDVGAIWIIASLVLLIPKKTRKAGILSLAVLLCSVVVNNLFLKNVFARTRPYDVIEGLGLLIQPPHDFSFPSGHAGSSFGSAVIFYKELPKTIGFPALALAFLIGFSRLYLGVHYPSDVICGAVIGSILALAVRRLYYFALSKKMGDREGKI